MFMRVTYLRSNLGSNFRCTQFCYVANSYACVRVLFVTEVMVYGAFHLQSLHCFLTFALFLLL